MQSLASFVPLILIIVIFYFFMIRPQSKQQKQLQEMRENMKAGDEVITIGGFYGIIYAVDDKNVVLELLPDFNKVMVVKTAISRVITEEESLLVEDMDDDSSLPENEAAAQLEDDVDENLVILGDDGNEAYETVDEVETAEPEEQASSEEGKA